MALRVFRRTVATESSDGVVALEAPRVIQLLFFISPHALLLLLLLPLLFELSFAALFCRFERRLFGPILLSLIRELVRTSGDELEAVLDRTVVTEGVVEVLERGGEREAVVLGGHLLSPDNAG